ncbi:MAG: T9SS type A sorting domain-containing protein, partial [Cytophagales bacterium]|nr:T9SS type A sorting domain-containing protein [Cytophagales bacterium]
TVTTGIIQSSFINFNLKLYPNPNDGKFLIRYSIPDKQHAEFIIFDVTGRKLKTYQLEGGMKERNIANKALKNGMYFYQVIVNNRIILTDKLIVIKH